MLLLSSPYPSLPTVIGCLVTPRRGSIHQPLQSLGQISANLFLPFLGGRQRIEVQLSLDRLLNDLLQQIRRLFVGRLSKI